MEILISLNADVRHFEIDPMLCIFSVPCLSATKLLYDIIIQFIECKYPVEFAAWDIG